MKKTETKQGRVKELKTLRARVAALEKSKRKISRVAAARREAEQFSHAIISTASEGIVVYDRAFRYLAWNPFMENLTGVPAAKVLGKRALEIFPHLRQQGVDCLLERALAGETVSSPDILYHVPPTGKSGWMVGTYYPRRNAEGRIVGVVGMIHDITERKRAEEEITSLGHQNEMILNSAGEGILGVDLHGNHTFVNPKAAAMLGYAAEELIGRHSHSTWHHTRADGSPYPMAECPIYAALKDGAVHRKTGEVFWRKDGTSFPTEFVSTPIYEQGKVTGAVVAFVDITERMSAEDALKKSEEYARSIIDSSLDMIITVDNQRRIVEFNQAAQDIFGYTREQVLGKHINLLYADPAEGQELHRTTFERGKNVQQVLNRRKNGEVFASQISAAVLRDSKGELLGVVGVSRDITETKRAEEARRQAEEKYRTIFENAVEGIFQSTPEGRFISANPGLARVWGYASPQELIASITNIAEQVYVDPAQRAEFQRRLQEHGEVKGFEFQVRRKDGSTMWVSENARAVRDAAGALLYYEGTTEDITARKQAEEALKNSLSLVEATLESTDNGILVVSREGTVIKANGRFAEMWRIPSDILASGEDEKLLNHVLGQLSDPDGFIAKVNELYGEPNAESFDLLYFKDGRVFERNSKPMLVAGEPKARVWSFLDITVRKRAENTLKESEEKYRDLFENANDLIQAVSPDGHFLYVNQAWRATLGYSDDEIAQRSIFDVIAPEDRLHCQELFARVMGGENLDRLEVTFVAKSGKRITVEGHVNCKFIDGKPASTRGIFRNITDRKQVEREILFEKTRFQQLFENSPIGIAMLDAKDRIQAINPAFQTIFQYTPEQVIGRFINDLIIPSSSQEEASRLSAQAMSGAAMQIETVRQRKDGTLVPVEVYGVPIVRDGKVIGIYGMYADITQAKQMESQLKREVEKLGALHQIDRALSTLDLHACLEIIVKEARALFASDLVAILLSEGDQLRLVAEEGLVSASKVIRIPLTSGISGWCSTHGESVLVADVTHDARYLAVDPRTRAEMAAPLSVQGACIGVLNVESTQVDAFTPADLELLESLAARAAAAIHNARLHAAEREHRQFAETLRDVGIALTSQLDPDAVLDQLLDLVDSVVPYDTAALLLLEGNRVRCKRQRGFDKLGLAQWMQEYQVPLDGLASLRKIVESGQPYVISDTYTDPNWTTVEQTRHIRSWIGAPINIRGTLIGFLSLDKLEPGFYTDQMVERLVAFASQAGMALDNARLYAEQQQLAVTDGMTGLSNSRHFVEVAQRELVRASRMRSPFAVLMIDLDDFKQVNDTFGHSAGDQALQLVAKLLASHVRAIDVVARYGGDEFVMLLPDSNQRAAEQIAARLREGVRALRLAVPTGTIELDFSVGVAIATLAPEETLDSLLVRADADMYAVKQRKALASAT